MKFSNNNAVFDSPKLSVIQEVGDRSTQQDRFVICHTKLGLLIAIADGHGGETVADLVAFNLAKIFEQQLSALLSQYSLTSCGTISDRLFKQVIRKTVKKLVDLAKNETSGSTFSLVLIEQGYFKDNGYLRGARVTTAQLGDSVIALSKRSGHLIAPTL